MSLINILVIIAIVVVSGVLIWVLTWPSEIKIAAKAQKKKDDEQMKKQKDWENIAARQEKHIQTLNRQMEEQESKFRSKEKELEQHVKKSQELVEKLAMEKNWREKEQADVDKKGQEFQRMKKDLLESQKKTEEEHFGHLRFEKETKESKQTITQLQDKLKNAETEIMNLKANVDFHKKELADLKKENATLKKEQTDTTWIAKSDFDALQKTLKEKENELDRIRRQQNP